MVPSPNPFTETKYMNKTNFQGAKLTIQFYLKINEMSIIVNG